MRLTVHKAHIVWYAGVFLVAGLVAAVTILLGAVVGGPEESAPVAVELNSYCSPPSATGQLVDGRTAYCTQVARTETYVWSYSRHPLPRDPNTRGYTCDGGDCHFPGGAAVPGYQRCGILCGEPPTAADLQSGLSDCFDSGAPFEECEAHLRR